MVINGITGFIFAVVCLYAITNVDDILEAPAGAISEIYLQVTVLFEGLSLDADIIQATRNRKVTVAMIAVNPIIFGCALVGVGHLYPFLSSRMLILCR